MEVILLERVAKLGQMGDVVRVKDGFARNYLLPKGKALRATNENRARFETMKVTLETRNLEQKGDAEKIAKKLDGQSFTVLRQAAEGGQLYGSVSPRDLAALVTESGFGVTRAQIALNAPIKTIGLHKVPVLLHPEVEVTINVTVGRNADEAQRIARGEDVISRREEESAAPAEESAAPAGTFFEPEAVEARRTTESAPDAPATEAAAPQTRR
jgi:large subunit ribosomal protein L9